MEEKVILKSVIIHNLNISHLVMLPPSALERLGQ